MTLYPMTLYERSLESRLGVCQPCAILDNDRGLKAVRWCSVCGAWLCEYCRTNWDRRVRAAFTEFF